MVNQCWLTIVAIFTPANINDRDSAPAMASAAECVLCLADLRYQGEEAQNLLIEEDELPSLNTAKVRAKHT